MTFDVAQTPTLQAVATQDEQLLTLDLQKRAEESIGQVESQPEVAQACEAQNVAEERLHRLQKAERFLSQFAKESHARMLESAQAALDAIVESAASGGKLDFKKLETVVALENQIHYTRRAIQRIIEHLLPLAQIASLREESHTLMTRSRAVQRVAQERAEKVLGQLREAVTDEVVLPVDMSKGVAGALLAHAAGLKRRAIQISENADQIERSHRDREAAAK